MGQLEPQVSSPHNLVAFLEHIRERQIQVDADCYAGFDVSMAATVQPIDEQLNPVGDSFVAVTKNISAAGLVMTHTRLITDRFLWITLHAHGRELQMMLDVVRCRCMGMHYDTTCAYWGPEL